MDDRPAERPFLAIIFLLRERLYALEQRGAAPLLPWLQRYARPSAAPGLPDWCQGVLNVRGTVQMVVDLGCLLGLGLSAITDQSRLIFIEHGSAQLGMMVDREIGVRTVRRADVARDHGVPFIAGGALFDDRAVTVLNGAEIMQHIAGALRAPAYLR
ncbi:MAG TPA: chemotaxis protein CheW [Chloroflexota bacterium]|jgi:purine-binding chemotaxis protein CheW|nr:chemotaxis protein CheW [Chloroflexota bacterium]